MSDQFLNSAEMARGILDELSKNDYEVDGLSKQATNLLNALQRDDNLGFDTPSQALYQIINNPNETLTNYDVSPQLKSALTKYDAPDYRPKESPVLERIGDPAPDVDYRGSHQAPTSLDDVAARFDDMTGIMPEDVYGPQGERLYGLQNPKVDRETFSQMRAARGNPDAMVDIFRAVPSDVDQINTGDWVSPSREYADMHGEAALGGDYKVLEGKVPARKLFSEGYPYELGVKYGMGGLGMLGFLGLAGMPREAQAQGLLEMLVPPTAESLRVMNAGEGSDMPMTDEQYNAMVRSLNAR